MLTKGESFFDLLIAAKISIILSESQKMIDTSCWAHVDTSRFGVIGLTQPHSQKNPEKQNLCVAADSDDHQH